MFVACLGGLGCAKTQVTPSTGTGETHFLSTCETACSGDLECLCGVCTKPCGAEQAAADACEALGGSCLDSCGGPEMQICDRTCSTDADCGELGDDFRCDDGRCRAPTAQITPDAGGVDTGHPMPQDASMRSDAAVALGCPTDCGTVLGYRVDQARGCVDMTESGREPIGCSCGSQDPIERYYSCFERLSDSSLWLHTGAVDDSGDWAPCTPEQRTLANVSCAFAECAQPPVTVCSLKQFCAVIDCGGYEYHEDGCRRVRCTADSECAQDERCTRIECADATSCTLSQGGSCDCVSLDLCAIGNVCVPIEMAGPAGSWVRFGFRQGAGPCQNEQGCFWSWDLFPDGSFEYASTDETRSGELTEDELWEVKNLVDGPELRAAIRDGFACDGPPTDVSVGIELELSTELLSRDVTGCAIAGPEGNLFQALFLRIKELAQ